MFINPAVIADIERHLPRPIAKLTAEYAARLEDRLKSLVFQGERRIKRVRKHQREWPRMLLAPTTYTGDTNAEVVPKIAAHLPPVLAAIIAGYVARTDAERLHEWLASGDFHGPNRRRIFMCDTQPHETWITLTLPWNDDYVRAKIKCGYMRRGAVFIDEQLVEAVRHSKGIFHNFHYREGHIECPAMYAAMAAALACV